MMESWLISRKVTQFSIESPDYENEFIALLIRLIKLKLQSPQFGFDSLFSSLWGKLSDSSKNHFARILLFNKDSRLQISESKAYSGLLRQICITVIRNSYSISYQSHEAVLHFFNTLLKQAHDEKLARYDEFLNQLKQVLSSINNSLGYYPREFFSGIVEKTLDGSASPLELSLYSTCFVSHPYIFTNSFPTKICFLIHDYIEKILKKPAAEFTVTTLQNFLCTLIEKLNSDLRHISNANYPDAVTHLIEAVLTCSLSFADPLPLWRGNPSVPLASKAQKQTFVPQTDYVQISFQLGMHLLSRYPRFSQQKKDCFMGIIHEVFCYSVINPNSTFISTIKTILTNQLLTEEDQLFYIHFLLDMPFLSSEKKPLPCYANSVWYFKESEDSLLSYRFFCYNLAFEMLNAFGTTYEEPKKGSTFARQIWKPKFEPLLNQLCQDVHPSIRHSALNSVLTGKVQVSQEEWEEGKFNSIPNPTNLDWAEDETSQSNWGNDDTW